MFGIGSFFSALVQRLESLVDRILYLVQAVTLQALLLFGIATLCVTVVTALLVPNQPAAVMLAAFGSMLGTFIVCQVIPKLILLKVQRAVKTATSTANSKMEDYERISQEKANLEREVQRLRGLRIESNTFRPILKLGLLEVEAEIKDIARKQLLRKEEGKIEKGEYHEFLGVMQVSLKANFGVDLTKVRFSESSDGSLLISGLKPEFQGALKQDETWLLKEVRVFKWGGRLGMGGSEHWIDDKDGRIADQLLEQRKLIQDKIEKGLVFKHHDASILQFAKTFLGAVMAPFATTISFSEECDENGMNFAEFLEHRNRKIDSQISAKEAEIRRLPSPPKQLVEMPALFYRPE